jgi:hypothetical protein
MYILSYLNKKNIFLSLFLAFFVLGGVVFLGGAVSAVDGIDKALNGLGKSATKGYLGEDTAINREQLSGRGIMVSIPGAIGKVLGAGLSLIGIVFLILMIYAGFRWMIARGNEADVEKAKKLIEAAIAGLVIVIAAYAITAFIGNILV